jgi:hypothetical protein
MSTSAICLLFVTAEAAAEILYSNKAGGTAPKYNQLH